MSLLKSMAKEYVAAPNGGWRTSGSIRSVLLGAALAGTLFGFVSPAAAQSARPNVVFILADNVGYGDLGVYGGGRRGARRRRGSINSRTRG
jgi:hypothetical protein